ncbi:MAG TPA: BamA/TamA family outer membrane protein [Gemmatimonadaceae bacterium]|nr:BamA/TamA family outer membrane protein [Gemmatimonadaceae bacterium]
MTWWGAFRAATIALVAIAAGAMTPALLEAQDLSCERGDMEVRDLDFRGNSALDDDDLALRIAITPSSRARRLFHLPIGEKRCLDRRELANDIARLKEYYRQRGFYSTQVDTAVQNISNDAVRVTFLIDEGRPTLLRTYNVTGLDTVAEGSDIIRRLRLRVGEPFDLRLFAADIDSIVSRLRNAGYYRASQIQGHDLDTTATGYADAFITVLPGKRARFGSPRFSIEPAPGRGVQIDSSVVRRVLGIVPGTMYSDRAIVEAQRNLFQLGTYRHVEVAPLPESEQDEGDTVVVLAVRLTEDYMKQLDSEIGWATLDCVRARLQYTDRNLFGTARRLEISAQATKIGYGAPLASDWSRNVCTLGNSTPLKLDDEVLGQLLNYYLGFALRQPRLLGTRWVPTLSLYSERRREYRAFLRTTYVGSDFSAMRDVGDRMPLRLGYTFEYGKTEASDAAYCALFNRCDPTSRENLKQALPLGVASATFSRSRLDDPLNPRRGTFVRWQARTSASPLLGTSESLFFNKGTGDLTWYAPVNSRSVAMIRLRGGVVLGRRLDFSDANLFIPPQERLYAGGPTSVRGFQQNELGAAVYIARANEVTEQIDSSGPERIYHFEADPDDAGNINPERAVPLGGSALFVANVEYRLRDPFFLPDLLQYTFFLDGGDVGVGKLSRIKWTPGFGLRALTPVGPVQVNVGYNGYRREPGELYHNPDVNSLACATPGNQQRYRRNAAQQLELIPPDRGCPDFSPPRRKYWYQRLTFTFSIGPDF